MFSGIIETTSTILAFKSGPGFAQIKINKPSNFNDLNLGDSVAVNGVCLTVEQFDVETISFTLAAETLQVTGWNQEKLSSRPLNLERSLKIGDRVHGHLVTGHVDAMGKVIERSAEGESQIFQIGFPDSMGSYIWPKGSVAINGVSLTINTVSGNALGVCLIPETLKRTNLDQLSPGDEVTLEVDNMARAWVWNQSERGSNV